MTIPVIGHVVVLGGLSMLGAALYGSVHSSAEEITRAKEILGTFNPSRLGLHQVKPPQTAATQA